MQLIFYMIHVLSLSQSIYYFAAYRNVTLLKHVKSWFRVYIVLSILDYAHSTAVDSIYRDIHIILESIMIARHSWYD